MDRPLKLEIVIANLHTGGAQALLPGFITAAQDAGIEVGVSHLIAPETVQVDLGELGIEPVAMSITSLLGPGGHRRMRAHLARVRPDLVHTHLGYADIFGGIAARSLGVPSVSTLHTVEWSSGPMGERLKTHLEGYTRRACAARVIAVSEAVRAGYLEYRWDRPDRVVTVHNGILDAAAGGTGAGLREELGIGPDEIVLTIVAMLRDEKAGLYPPPGAVTTAGHDVLASALPELVGAHPELRVLVVGDGPERDRVEALFAGCRDRVEMLGRRDDVARILDATDVVVHPAYVDAFPTVLIEALAASVPVVATAAGGIGEIVEDGRTGSLIEAPPRPRALAEALEPLLVDPDLRRRYGAAGRSEFELRFTTDRWVERTLAVYEEVLGRPVR